MPTVRIRGDNKEAIKRLDEIIRKFDNAEQTARKSSKATKQGFDSVTDTLKKYSLGLTDIVSGLAVYDIAVNSLRKGIGFMKSFVSESAKQQEANLKLKFSIMAVGETLDRVYPKMTQKISDMQNATGVGDESLAGAFSLLNDYVKDSSKSIELLLPIMGFAAFRGRSLETIIDAVGKAIGIGMTDYLKRYGIIIDETAFKTDRFGAMLKALEKYKDVLPMRLDTYAGRMEKIANDMGDIKQAFAMPVLDSLLQGLAVGDDNMQSMKDAAAEFGESLREPVLQAMAWLGAGSDMLSKMDVGKLAESLSSAVRKFFEDLGDPRLWSYVGDTVYTAIGSALSSSVAKALDPKLMFMKVSLSDKITEAKGRASRARDLPGATKAFLEAAEIQSRISVREKEIEDRHKGSYPAFPSDVFAGTATLRPGVLPEGYDVGQVQRDILAKMRQRPIQAGEKADVISFAQAQGALAGVREEGLLGLQKLFADRGKKFNYGEISNLVYGTGLYGDIGSAMRGELQRGGAPLSVEEQMAITKAGNQYLAPQMSLSQGQQETLGLNRQSTESNTKALEDNTRAMINMVEYLKAYLTTGSFAAGRAWIGGF